MKYIVILLWVIILMFLLTSCGHFNEYKSHCNTQGTYWNRDQIRIRSYLNAQDDKDLEIAINKWNDVLNNKPKFLIVGLGPNEITVEYDGRKFENNQQAIATVYTSTSIITGARISINTDLLNKRNYHFESLLIHELGHTLGLNHENNTVMNWSLSESEIRNVIDNSTISKVKCLYGG